MPKFLDVPSWYNSQGTLSYGVGVDTDELPTVGDVPCVHLPSGELNWRALMVNGGQSGDISIFAPTSNPPGGQVLLSSGTDAPVWQDFDVNGNAIGTGAYSTSIYAPGTAGSAGQILRSAGFGAPVWSDAAMLFVNYTFPAGNGYLSSVLGPIWNAPIAYIAIGCTSLSGSGTFAGVSVASGEAVIILNSPSVRGGANHYAITPDLTIEKMTSNPYSVSSGTYVAYGFGFNF